MSSLRGLFRTGAISVLCIGLLSAGLTAQTEPPPPLPLGATPFPSHEERTLSNGARVIVVTHTEVPYVTVNLVVPGGSAADPPGQAGVAELTAGLLTKGSATRSAMEIAGAVDHLGAVLEAAAAPDWTNVTLGVLRSGLDVGLELMSDVVMDPSFPREELEILRDQKLAQLRIQLGQPQVQAGRFLTRELFGEHPYGVLTVRPFSSTTGPPTGRSGLSSWWPAM